MTDARNLGVRRDEAEGRLWNFVATIPELAYSLNRLRGRDNAAAVSPDARDPQHQELFGSVPPGVRLATSVSISGRSMSTSAWQVY